MENTKVMKLHIHPCAEAVAAFKEMTSVYKDACNYVSQYVFDNGFVLNTNELNAKLYSSVRSMFGLKSQMTQSAFIRV